MKCDDDSQTTMSNTKKDEEEERTQLDDSNVRVGNDTLHLYEESEKRNKIPSVGFCDRAVTVLFRNCQTVIWTV